MLQFFIPLAITLTIKLDADHIILDTAIALLSEAGTDA